MFLHTTPRTKNLKRIFSNFYCKTQETSREPGNYNVDCILKWFNATRKFPKNSILIREKAEHFTW